MKASKTDAFTLIELLVVISIIAILAGIALPVFGSVQIKGAQTKALSNAKQIGTALRLYAVDNNGIYPSYVLDTNGKPANPPVIVKSSNEAFAQLVPDYLPGEDIFWLTKSKWCNPTPPDNQIDAPGTVPPTLTLAKGENEWAYCPTLNDTSNPSFPLIADGFAPGSEKLPVYDPSDANPGGVWKAKGAIVIRCDTSGAILKPNQKTYEVKGPVNAGGGTEGNIFVSVPATWIPNQVLNPL